MKKLKWNLSVLLVAAVFLFTAVSQVMAGQALRNPHQNPNIAPQVGIISGLVVSPSGATTGEEVSIVVNVAKGCDGFELDYGDGSKELAYLAKTAPKHRYQTQGKYVITARETVNAPAGFDSCKGQATASLMVVRPKLDSADIQPCIGDEMVIDINAFRAASNKFINDYASYAAVYKSYLAQVGACLTKNYAAQDMKTAGCTTNQSIQQCEHRLFVNCMDPASKAMKSVYIDRSNLEAILGLARGQALARAGTGGAVCD